ncbi:MAG: hypothetical protein Q8942_06175 [Bacillota bacterium]|nr:hypothetical protein [Bacillota bacterium]
MPTNTGHQNIGTFHGEDEGFLVRILEALINQCFGDFLFTSDLALGNSFLHINFYA